MSLTEYNQGLEDGIAVAICLAKKHVKNASRKNPLMEELRILQNDLLEQKASRLLGER